MEFTTANPFIPKASVIRYANSVFEARIHLPGAAAHIDVVPHENLILVTGSLAPRVHIDAEGKPSTLVFTDQPCGVFGRDIPVNLTQGTELVVLAAHQNGDDYIIRYTIRNSITPRANCADYANAAAGTAAAPGRNSPGMRGGCGSAAPGMAAGACHCVGAGVFGPSGCVRPGTFAVPPALLGRGPGACGGIAPAPRGYGCAGYPAYNPGYYHPYGLAHGAGLSNPGYMHGYMFHPNGGATL